MRKIELLSPAKDLECGLEAIRHGADAVYIGGPAFGARAAAANSVEDIAQLCDYAHLFNAKVYVTINTILWDSELREVENVVKSLYDVGVDALIVQDMAMLKLNLPPIALHASTQMDNRTPDKARFLERQGFSQIVLARELPLEDIAKIHRAVNVPIEAFVHGALCVSYSGRCYASQHCFNRSANRGCCAQFCRMKFDLLDGNDNVLIKDKHLLSLRDMNCSNDLEAMMDAGVSSFKIEGRLKSVTYVKNVTAYYRRKLDEILERRATDYERASSGSVTYTFTPNLQKSFNRGFTDYFLHGRRNALHNFFTPKAMGEPIGRVADLDKRRLSFTVRLLPGVTLSAGDGLCFIDNEQQLQGCRVNRVEGSTVFLSSPVDLHKDAELFRNLDFSFDKALMKPTAERKLAVYIHLEETADGYRLELTDETGESVTNEVPYTHEDARTPQADNITRQLTKLGNTPFVVRTLNLSLNGNRFIPSSVVAEWRRQAVLALELAHKEHYQREVRRMTAPGTNELLPDHLDYTANVANAKAEAFYKERGVSSVDKAYELKAPEGAMIMDCKYCLRHALNACLRRPEEAKKWQEPFLLRTANGQLFPLKFDCRNCQMKIYAMD